jgi:hypothetical protein
VKDCAVPVAGRSKEAQAKAASLGWARYISDAVHSYRSFHQRVLSVREVETSAKSAKSTVRSLLKAPLLVHQPILGLE